MHVYNILDFSVVHSRSNNMDHPFGKSFVRYRIEIVASNFESNLAQFKAYEKGHPKTWCKVNFLFQTLPFIISYILEYSKRIIYSIIPLGFHNNFFPHLKVWKILDKYC